jgi:hypothetical protein
MKNITLNTAYGDIEVKLDGKGAGTIKSSLHDDSIELPGAETEFMQYEAAIDAVESLLLSLACEGVNITTPQFKLAVETTVEAANNYYA